MSNDTREGHGVPDKGKARRPEPYDYTFVCVYCTCTIGMYLLEYLHTVIHGGIPYLSVFLQTYFRRSSRLIGHVFLQARPTPVRIWDRVVLVAKRDTSRCFFS